MRGPDNPIGLPARDKPPPDTLEPPAIEEQHPDASAEKEVAAVVTRAQAKKRAPRSQPLKTPAPSSEPPQSDSYAEEQERDETLKTCFAQIGKESKNPKN